MPDHHRSLDRALARSAAPAERFAAVLTRHQMVGEPSLLSSSVGWIWGCSCRATGATAARSVAFEEYRAHVAAALAAVADDGLAERVRALADEAWARATEATSERPSRRRFARDLRALLSPVPSADRDERDGA